MSDDNREKLWNIDLVVKEIQEFPQTYKTILADNEKDTTCQFMLRKKLNRLCKDGIVCKTTIPGTRFGKAIFYVLPKKYYILVEAARTGSNVYCFFKYEKVGTKKAYVNIEPCWMLEFGKWKKKNKVVIFGGDILKWI